MMMSEPEAAAVYTARYLKEKKAVESPLEVNKVKLLTYSAFLTVSKVDECFILFPHTRVFTNPRSTFSGFMGCPLDRRPRFAFPSKPKPASSRCFRIPFSYPVSARIR